MPRLVIELPADKIKAGEAEIRKSVKAIGADVKILTSEVLKQERALESASRRYAQLAARIDPGVKKTQELARAQAILDSALRTGAIGQAEYERRLAQVRSQIIGLGAATERARSDFQRLAASLDPAAARTLRLAEAQRTLDQALRAGVITQADYNRYLGLAGGGFQQVEGRALSLGRLLPAVFSVAAISGFVRSLVEAERKLEQIEKRFVAASGGDRGAAAKEFEFARAEAARLGLQLEATARGYSRLAVASRSTSLEGAETRRIFSGLAEASAALSLSGEETERILRAVEQMMSKGKITAEEMRQQLGDSLPGAAEIFARAVGVSVKELDAMLKKGEVLAEEVLPRVAEILHEDFGELALQNLTSLSGSVNQLETAWFRFKTAVTDSDFFARTARGIASALDELAGAMERNNTAIDEYIAKEAKARGVEFGDEERFLLERAYYRQNAGGPESETYLRRAAEIAAERARRAEEEAKKLRVRPIAEVAASGRSDVLDPAALEEYFERQAEAQKKATKETEAHRRAYRELLKELNPVKAAFLELDEQLDAIAQNPFVSELERTELALSAIQETLKEVDVRPFKELDFERDVLDLRDVEKVLKDIQTRYGGTVDFAKELHAIGVDAVDKMGDEWLEANEAVAKHETEVRELELAIIDTGYAIADAFAGSQYGDAIAALTQIYESILAIRDASTDAQRAQGWAGLAQGVGQAGRAAGWWGPKGGQGTFGPKEGNYATEGAAIGAVIGAIIGSIVPAIGTAVGAVVGGVLGEVIGSAIKHGAPEAKAEIRMEADKFITDVYRDEGGLGGIVEEIGQKLINGLDQVLAAVGAEMESLPSVRLKVRGDHVSVVVGAMYAKFESVDEAISFAITQIMRQGEISGSLSPNVKAALENTLAGSLEELISDIDFAISIDRIGMRPVEVAIENYLTEYRAAIERATQLGLDTSKVGLGLALNLQSERSALLGIEEDPAERIRRDAAIFNARVQMLEAEETANLAKLELDRATLAAEIELMIGEEQLNRAKLQSHARFLQADAALVGAESELLGIKLEQLAAIDAAIGATSTLLENLPPLISEGEISQAIARARSGGDGAVRDFGTSVGKFGGLVDRWRDAIREFRDAVHDLKFNEATTALTLQEQSELAYGDYQKLLARAKTGDVAALEEADDALRRFLELYKSYTGGGQGFLGDFGDVFDQLIKEAEAFAAGPRPQRLRDGNVVFDRRFHDNQREQIQTQERHRREAREDVRALTAVVERGNQQARDLAEQIRREGRSYGVGR